MSGEKTATEIRLEDEAREAEIRHFVERAVRAAIDACVERQRAGLLVDVTDPAPIVARVLGGGE